MAVMTKNGHRYIYFRPFKMDKVGLKLDVRTKGEAKHIESMILKSCRTGSYGSLDLDSREACIRMFENRGWELPLDLRGDSRPREELTLRKAIEVFLKYPEINASPTAWRYVYAFDHLADKLGKDRPVKSLRVPDLKTYRIERQKQGAAPATINREMSTLSRLFQVLIELEYVDTNPVRSLNKRLSEKSGERQVYLSLRDVLLIIDRCPKWFKPIVFTAYYTGMRRGEILDLTRKQVNLSGRIITLYPVKGSQGAGTKEGHWKRVPIHRELVPVLEETFKLSMLGSEKVFLLQDGQTIQPLGIETFKNPWPRACEALEEEELLQKPFPRFHDLRHTWKTNARRSGMGSEITEAILGHAERGKSVTERYGRISNQELLNAIDRMTFDHGETEIIVAGGSGEGFLKKGNCMVTGGSFQRKRPRRNVT